MSSILTSILIQLGVFIVKKFGIPFLEGKFPMLTPLLEEILKVIRLDAAPSQELSKSAMHFADLKNTSLAQVSDVKTV